MRSWLLKGSATGSNPKRGQAPAQLMATAMVTAAGIQITMLRAGLAVTETALTENGIGTGTGNGSIAAQAETEMADIKGVAATAQIRTEQGIGRVQLATGHPQLPCWTSLRRAVCIRAKSAASWTLAALWSCKASEAGWRALCTSPICPRQGTSGKLCAKSYRIWSCGLTKAKASGICAARQALPWFLCYSATAWHTVITSCRNQVEDSCACK